MLGAGATIAGWNLERELGRGAMGTVYLARHPRLPRQDAIKVLHDPLNGDSRYRRRFLREARRVGALDHPHVAAIYDQGEADDHLFIVMQYIEGMNLRAAMNAGRLPPADALLVLEQVASALDAAHSSGLVHRDVKPENVLVTWRAPQRTIHAFLVDFGIAQARTATTALTTTGELLATVGYAAPEQIVGKPTSAQTDVYSLACLALELLTGHLPFE